MPFWEASPPLTMADPTGWTDGGTCPTTSLLPPPASCSKASQAFSSGFETAEEETGEARDTVTVDEPVPAVSLPAPVRTPDGGEEGPDEDGEFSSEFILAAASKKRFLKCLGAPPPLWTDSDPPAAAGAGRFRPVEVGW